MRNKGNDDGITLSRQICKYCADLEAEKLILEHEIDRLENRIQEMSENKETEIQEMSENTETDVSNRFSVLLDDLYRENRLLKERLSVEERRNEYSPTQLYKRIQSIKEEYQKQKDNIKHQNAGIVAPWKLDSQYSFPAERDDMEMKERIDYLEKENKRLNSSNMETEVIIRFKEEASNKEKEIRRLQEWIKTEERKSAQLYDLSEDSKRKNSLLQR